MASLVLISQEPRRFPPEGLHCDGPRPCLIDFEKAMNFRAKPGKKTGHVAAM